ncbi:hypothetical protein HDE_04960 [Halotydeus destructor]|nr:hypothetical protein HDE_04960 [Halotydeus destructor]
MPYYSSSSSSSSPGSSSSSSSSPGSSPTRKTSSTAPSRSPNVSSSTEAEMTGYGSTEKNYNRQRIPENKDGRSSHYEIKSVASSTDSTLPMAVMKFHVPHQSDSSRSQSSCSSGRPCIIYDIPNDADTPLPPIWNHPSDKGPGQDNVQLPLPTLHRNSQVAPPPARYDSAGQLVNQGQAINRVGSRRPRAKSMKTHRSRVLVGSKRKKAASKRPMKAKQGGAKRSKKNGASKKSGKKNANRSKR